MDLLADKVKEIICHKCGATVSTAGLAPFSGVTCQGCGNRMSVPAKLANLLLLKPVGKGAMGVVYRAMDTSLRRNVAVKILKKEEDQEDKQQARLILQEARALAALNHPNVVHVFSIGMARDQPYIVMELVDGGRFDKVFAKDKPADELTCLRIVIDTAQGLNAALQAGLLHGDVKPANVLLNHDGVAKVIDFGIARRVDDDSGHGFIGTPYYVAPEIVQGGRLDVRCDIFSLGASLYNALTGRRPFVGQTVQEVINARLSGRIPDPRNIVPTIHPETSAVIARMTEPAPEHRFQNYEQVIAALSHVYLLVQSGPAPPQLADLGAAVSTEDPYEQPADDAIELANLAGPPGAQETVRLGMGSAAATASRTDGQAASRLGTRTAGRSRTIGGPGAAKKGLSTSALAGIIGGAVAVLVLIIVVALATGGGGGGLNLDLSVESFEGAELPPGWQSQGSTRMINGACLLEVNEPGSTASLGVAMPAGDGEFQFKLEPIEWNVDGQTRLAIRVEHVPGDEIVFAIDKQETNLPNLIVRQNDVEIHNAKLDTDPKALLLTIRYDARKRRYGFEYALDDGPSKKIDAKPPIEVAAPAGNARRVDIRLTSEAGGGQSTVSVDQYSYRPSLSEGE